MRRALLRSLLLAALILLQGQARAGSPVLSNLYPVAVERGLQVEATFTGERLADATAILFHTTGITAGDIEAEKNKVKTTLTIAPDAPLGEHKMRVLTKTGVTEMITLQVVDRPLVNEVRDEQIKDSSRIRQSTSFDQPQPVEPGTTILGRTEPEDIDYFSVELAQGQRLAVQVDGMRLGRGFTDSYLAVLNDERFEVAVSDDTPLLRQDPYVSFIAPKAGRYVIVVRDSGYEGGNDNWYLMHVGSFPRPAAVYPLGGRPGEQVALRFIGDAAGDFEQPITLPDQPDNDFLVVPERDGKRAPTGHAFRVNPLPNIHEGDSSQNNSMNDVAEAQALDLPVAFNGIIEAPGDNDFFKLKLRKGQDVTLRVFASSMGSPLDSVVNVWRADNKQHLQGNDDQGGPDSVVEFKAPEDGEYFVRVRDHRGRGGPAFVYRLEATAPAASLSTYIHRYDQNRPQSRQAIAVPRGNRFAALLRVDRSRVGGDLMPAIEGLPAGVTFAGYAPDGRTEMPVVFEVGADAELGARLVDLGAQGEVKGDSAERIVGHFSQVTPLVIGNPNRTEYAYTTLNTMPVAVTEAVPFKVDIAEPKAPLVKDGVMQLKVNVTRNDGYEGRVRLYLLWRPPGIGGDGQIELTKDKTEAGYNIDANNSTPTRGWPMVVYGFGDTPNGPVWVSSQLFEVRVEEPFVNAKLDKAKCAQGEAVEIAVELEHPREWQGEGELKLLGLPAGCTAEPITIKPGQKQAAFKVQTAENTPAGQHKTLMCELTIRVNGEPVVHRLSRGAQLRIDRQRNNPDAQARSDRGE